ncbi:MAG TPA: radical SAM protein, partial [Pelobium sp.]
KFVKLNLQHLQKMGVAINRAQHFISFTNTFIKTNFLQQANLKDIILNTVKSKYQTHYTPQLSLF